MLLSESLVAPARMAWSGYHLWSAFVVAVDVVAGRLLLVAASVVLAGAFAGGLDWARAGMARAVASSPPSTAALIMGNSLGLTMLANAYVRFGVPEPLASKENGLLEGGRFRPSGVWQCSVTDI